MEIQSEERKSMERLIMNCKVKNGFINLVISKLDCEKSLLTTNCKRTIKHAYIIDDWKMQKMIRIEYAIKQATQ